MTHDQAFHRFIDPPRDFGPIPFWFWNDDLEEEELIRQLRAFGAAGFGGVLPHARVGLSRTDEISLDMGQVGDIAEVLLDGCTAALRLWAPYRVRLGCRLGPGEHQLEIRVTNTMANAYEGAQLPSGLMGPLALVLHHQP